MNTGMIIWAAVLLLWAIGNSIWFFFRDMRKIFPDFSIWSFFRDMLKIIPGFGRKMKKNDNQEDSASGLR